MAVQVEIKQKGLVKKTWTIDEIIFDSIGYGVMDKTFRLEEGATGDVMVLYFLNNIQRGFEVTFAKGSITLRMALPSSNEEIKAFYAFVKHLCGLMKTDTFVRDGEVLGFDRIDECIRLDIDASVAALQNMRKALNENNYESLFIFGAINPIYISEEDFKEFNGNLDRFGDYLHKLQSMDVYYAAPHLFEKEDKTIFGLYPLTEEIATVLPRKPHIFSNDIKVEEWYVALKLDTEEPMAVDYETFCQNTDTTRKYDSGHFIVRLMPDQIEELAEKYGERIH